MGTLRGRALRRRLQKFSMVWSREERNFWSRRRPQFLKSEPTSILVTKRSYLKKSKMVTKWVPNGSNCIISPSFCISRRDLSNGGLPEAKNRFPKFGCAFFVEKKSPCGNARRLVRIFKKDRIFLEKKSPCGNARLLVRIKKKIDPPELSQNIRKLYQNIRKLSQNITNIVQNISK